MRLTALTLLALAGACAQPAPVSGPAPGWIGPGHARATGIWNEGTTFELALAARDRGGRLVLCGAWGMDRPSSDVLGHETEPLETVVVLADGRRLVQDLPGLPQLPLPLDGQAERCIALDQPSVAPGARLTLRLPRLQVPLDAEMGDRLTFRQLP